MAIGLEESLEQWIHDQIRKEVKSQLRRMAMARTREDFINRLVEVLMPALLHHYRGLLAELNNRTDQLEKWRSQEEGFLDQFAVRLRERSKAKGLDRKAAAEKALEEFMDHDAGSRRRESAKFQATYKLKKLVPLPDDAHESFVEKVRTMVEELLSD